MLPTLNTAFIKDFITEGEIEAAAPYAETAHRLLGGGNGPGSDFLGWLCPSDLVSSEELARINSAAARIRQDSDVLVVIGIGGSYLGARAALEFLRSQSYNLLPGSSPQILFAGNTLGADALRDVIRLCEGKRVSVNVISKSGTTTEPALAFRVFRELLYSRYGKEEAARRIYCTTDKARGTLKTLAGKEGYETFVIPDDVGGRYSVLTPVGLLPLAAAGCDIGALLEGAGAAAEKYSEPSVYKNDACLYAIIRNILYRKGYMAESLVSYDPDLVMLGEWYKQLFGESEGKDKKGLLPVSMCFSTDLHSLGQFVQDGRSLLFETVLKVPPREDFFLKPEEGDFDGLNFLTGQGLSAVNHKAFAGTLLAHLEGGVPNLTIDIPAKDEKSLGALIYFFEKACALSGYLLGVNPFDQPGVEEYKKNMFALLGKAGYEERKKALEEKLDYLKSVARAEVAEKIKIAREFGDISENAEFDAAKE
ncbi:MAG: glucose-6-phosphate isomerase, partial [Oscillospiraceae bacterium]|nr:glucose-6-phosphate isomerase [Oscillospiraceae bacterium]